MRDQRDSFYDITGPYTGDDGVKTGSVRLGLLWEPTTNLSVLLKTDYNYLDLSGYPADPVNATNDLFDITANARHPRAGPLRARGAQGRLRVRQRHDAALGIRLPGRPHGISRGPRRHERGQQHLRRHGRRGNLLAGDQPDLVRRRQASTGSSARTIRTTNTSSRPGEFYIGIPAGLLSARGYESEGNHGALRSGQLRLADGFELQVGARYSDSKTTNHIDVNQYGLPLTQEQKATFSNLSGKVSLNWTVNDHNFLYAFVATGFRPGGLNVPVGLG